MPAYVRLLANRRRSLITWFPLVQLIVIVAVDRLRLEVAVPTSSTNIYFTSGTAAPVVSVESTMLLPLLFVIVAVLFLTVAQRMGRELTLRPPLQAYRINLLGSLAGVATFAMLSWLELPPVVWFGVGFAAALPLMGGQRTATAVTGAVLLVASVALVYGIQEGSLWSPYYRITVFQDR